MCHWWSIVRGPLSALGTAQAMQWCNTVYTSDKPSIYSDNGRIASYGMKPGIGLMVSATEKRLIGIVETRELQQQQLQLQQHSDAWRCASKCKRRRNNVLPILTENVVESAQCHKNLRRSIEWPSKGVNSLIIGLRTSDNIFFTFLHLSYTIHSAHPVDTSLLLTIGCLAQYRFASTRLGTFAQQ